MKQLVTSAFFAAALICSPYVFATDATPNKQVNKPCQLKGKDLVRDKLKLKDGTTIDVYAKKSDMAKVKKAGGTEAMSLFGSLRAKNF